MSPHPLRLLVCAYALGALLGAAAWREAGPLVGVATIWLSGAALALFLAATPGLRGFFRAERRVPCAEQGVQAAEEAALFRDIAQWESDRRADAAPVERKQSGTS
jgi:hypothetical protein